MRAGIVILTFSDATDTQSNYWETFPLSES